jgi:hypothetical protein
MRSVFVTLVLLGGVAHAEDKPAIHGMLMFGSHPVYVSHLPMFHAPHDYQAIVAIRFDHAGWLAYRDAIRTRPIYTLVPEKFMLPELGAATPEKPFRFHADLVRGHFERGGETFAKNVNVETERVLYFRKLDPAATKGAPALFVFGSRYGGTYAAHVIAGKPDFDQVVSVAPSGLTEDELASGVIVQTASAAKPLEEGKAVKGTVGAEKKAITMLVVQQIYLEWDDLKD